MNLAPNYDALYAPRFIQDRGLLHELQGRYLNPRVGQWLVAGGYLLPAILRPLYVPWMLLAAVLGWVMTRVLLTLTFYVMITPIGLLRRIFGHDSLNRKFPGEQESYWEPWEEPEGGHTRHYKPF